MCGLLIDMKTVLQLDATNLKVYFRGDSQIVVVVVGGVRADVTYDLGDEQTAQHRYMTSQYSERCPHFRGIFILRKHFWGIVKCP